MTAWKSLTLAFLIAPLSTFPATLLSGLLFRPFMDGRAIDFDGLLLIAAIGTIIFSYPATIILGVSIYALSRKHPIGKNPWLYIITALGVTAVLANSELLDKNGFYGLIYLSSAAGCSWLFWFIAIKWPSGIK